ncbi:MAG TPA: hypothetical protein PKE59_00135 [Novosphingobium sp.]|jgi:hypothetical protein|nr:hypothetical protein [Novosphingobium sp.]
MTLEEFRASVQLMTPADYDATYGPVLADICQPREWIRCYDSGAWIIYRADGTHWLDLEGEFYSTADGYSLPEMEATLWRWLGHEPI